MDNKENEDKKENNENIENKEENKEEEEKKEEEKNEENKSNKENNNKDNQDTEQINQILDSNRRITSNDLKEASTLILEEKDCNIFNGEKIKINAMGMVDGGRGVGDGVTIFGSNLNQQDDSANIDAGATTLKPDFILNIKEKFPYPYIFMIYYEKDSKSYFIRPYSGKNNDNRILYIKLTNGYNLRLKQKEIISAGNIIFQISPIENNNLEIVNLSKQSLSMIPKQTFDASSKKEVTIGRNKDCDFSFPNNKSFSRTQTTFEYDEENQEWIIIDGSRTKSSTNGTWVFCSHSFPIKDKMLFEVLNYRVQINEEVKGE